MDFAILWQNEKCWAEHLMLTESSAKALDRNNSRFEQYDVTLTEGLDIQFKTIAVDNNSYIAVNINLQKTFLQ